MTAISELTPATRNGADDDDITQPTPERPATSDLAGWEISFATTLEHNYPSIPAAEKAAMAMEAGLPGVARAIAFLSGNPGSVPAASDVTASC